MLTYPHIDPVALQIGPLAVHWYGLTYLAAFGLFMLLGIRRLRHEPFVSITGPGAWSRKDVEDILFLGVVGVVAGGRLGYCLFYKRLEQGRFVWPQAKQGEISLSMAQLSMLLEGIDWRQKIIIKRPVFTS